MKSILIVEDNTELQGLYQEALNKKGFTDVVCTSSVAKGMELMAGKIPDLLILDVMLPDGSNGFDMLEQMKKDEQYAKVPVFMITNLDSQEKLARKIGVVEYLVKANTPFEEIIEKITFYLSNTVPEKSVMAQ